MGRDNGELNTLKPQPGQSMDRQFHPLPGPWAQKQLSEGVSYVEPSQPSSHQTGTSSQTPINRALSSERQQHEYWERWQGVTPGKPSYEDPRAFQSLLPVAKYGTDGRGD